MESLSRPAAQSQSQSLVVGFYAVCTTAGSVTAFALPKAVIDRACAPSIEQPEIESCRETQQFSQPLPLIAASMLLLTLGLLAGGLAWWRWRRIVHSETPVGVVDTPRVLAHRLRRRSALLVVAAWPVVAGLATGGSTTSEFVPGEQTCETRSLGADDVGGVAPTVVACEQHSVETNRTEVSESVLSLPLLVVGLALLAGTIAWWFRAWRLERVMRKPQYNYVTSVLE